MGALSTTYTVDDGWRHAIKDIFGVTPNEFEKIELTNRAQELAQGAVGDVVAPAYMDDLVPVDSTVGKVGSSGMSYVAATRVLTATMNVDFASTDVGKTVVFTDGTNTYMGTIESYGSTTTVVVKGDNLPASDIATVTSVIVIATLLSSSEIDISAVRMLRYGSEMNLVLSSTATKYVKRLNLRDFQRFQSTALSELDKIVWTLHGLKILLNKGGSISSYETVTFRYPRLPLVRSLTTDYLDILDGNMMWLYVAILRNLIAKRMTIEVPSNKDQIIDSIQSIYREFGGKIAVDDVKRRAEDLL